MSREKILSDYIEESRQRGLRKRTIECYTDCVRQYLNYLEENNIRVEETGPRHALDYSKHLTDKRRLQKATASYHIESLKSYYQFLIRKGRVYNNPFKCFQRRPHEKKIPKNLPREKEMDELLLKALEFDRGSRHTKAARYKFHVLAELMYSTGMRIHEAGSLKVEDVDYEKGVVYIREGKGGKSRTAFLNEYAKGVLKIYIETTRSILFDNKIKRSDNLFGVTPERLQITANKEFKRLGLYTSHVFRHSVGYHLLRSGCDIRFIQEILGHEQLKSTEIYTKVDKEALKKEIDKYHPRKWNETK